MPEQVTDALAVRSRSKAALPRTDDRRTVVDGVVEHGDQRGRELGFPTANLAIDDATASDGVWLATVKLPDGRLVPATVSIGRRTTFYGRDGVRLLEAHLLDLSEDLYDQHIRVTLESRLRLQKRFASVDALIEQMQSDVDDTRRWAAVAPWFVIEASRTWSGEGASVSASSSAAEER